MQNIYKKIVATAITLVALITSATAQTASSSYLDIDNYESINTAGWTATVNYGSSWNPDRTTVSNFYNYTVNSDKSAWLTIPVYAAVYHGIQNGGGQKWIKSSNEESEKVTWSANSPFKGSSSYFSQNARTIHCGDWNYSERKVTFYVTNASEVRLYGKNSWVDKPLSGDYPTSLNVYECTRNSNGTLSESQTPSQTQSNKVNDADIYFSINLTPTKIYKIVAGIYSGNLYEIAFKRPAPQLTVNPEQLSFTCDLNGNDTQEITVNGSHLKGNVTWELEDGNNVFTVSPTYLTPTNRTITNGKFTVTFHPTALGTGTYTGKVTLKTSGAESIVVNLKGTVNTPEISASPSSLTFNCIYSETDSKEITVNGSHLAGNVTWQLEDQNHVFSVSPANLSPTNGTITNGKFTVTFNPQERGDHEYTGKVTLTTTSGNTVEITLKANSTDVWIDVKISSAGISTFYCDYPVEIPKTPTGLQNVKYPYQIQGNSLQLYDWSDENNHIPANTGTILMGNEGTYRFYKYYGTVNSLPEGYPNLLSGTSTQLTREQALKKAGETEETAIIMTLAPGNETPFGFYKFIGQKLAAYKAYLIYKPTAGSNVSYFSIGGGENLDGIRDVKAVGDDDAWYTLQGARLNGKPTQRGIYIHGGKKVAVK